MKERKKKNVKGLLIYDDVKRKKRKKKESGLTYVRSKQQTKTYIYINVVQQIIINIKLMKPTMPKVVFFEEAKKKKGKGSTFGTPEIE